MARYAYVNGRYVDHREASVHIEDRGYQLADGVYEVVGVRGGKLIDEVPHIDRLDRSLRELRIGWPVSRNTLGFIIRELIVMLYSHTPLAAQTLAGFAILLLALGLVRTMAVVFSPKEDGRAGD